MPLAMSVSVCRIPARASRQGLLLPTWLCRQPISDGYIGRPMSASTHAGEHILVNRFSVYYSLYLFLLVVTLPGVIPPTLVPEAVEVLHPLDEGPWQFPPIPRTPSRQLTTVSDIDAGRTSILATFLPSYLGKLFARLSRWLRDKSYFSEIYLDPRLYLLPLSCFLEALPPG